MTSAFDLSKQHSRQRLRIRFSLKDEHLRHVNHAENERSRNCCLRFWSSPHKLILNVFSALRGEEICRVESELRYKFTAPIKRTYRRCTFLENELCSSLVVVRGNPMSQNRNFLDCEDHISRLNSQHRTANLRSR
jgi:hypothetical protein